MSEDTVIKIQPFLKMNRITLHLHWVVIDLPDSKAAEEALARINKALEDIRTDLTKGGVVVAPYSQIAQNWLTDLSGDKDVRDRGRNARLETDPDHTQPDAGCMRDVR